MFIAPIADALLVVRGGIICFPHTYRTDPSGQSSVLNKVSALTTVFGFVAPHLRYVTRNWFLSTLWHQEPTRESSTAFARIKHVLLDHIKHSFVNYYMIVRKIHLLYSPG